MLLVKYFGEMNMGLTCKNGLMNMMKLRLFYLTCILVLETHNTKFASKVLVMLNAVQHV